MNRDEKVHHGLALNSIPNQHPISRGHTGMLINLRILTDFLKSREKKTKSIASTPSHAERGEMGGLWEKNGCVNNENSFCKHEGPFTERVGKPSPIVCVVHEESPSYRVGKEFPDSVRAKTVSR